MLVVNNRQSWQHTAAILRVLHQLGWPWRLAWIGAAVPSAIRDAAYRWVARNRYGLFSRSDVCLMPAAETVHRFLE